MSLLKNYQEKNTQKNKEYSLEEYLKKCKTDISFYESPAERILNAIGEPKIINTKEDDRLGRLFYNKKIKTYPAFEDFYGMEDTIEQIELEPKRKNRNFRTYKTYMGL